MLYSKGVCDECGNIFIGRFRIKRILTWEHCKQCDNDGNISGFPMLTCTWDDYVLAMEDGAVLLHDE